MRPPASVAFQLITFRGASARGRRPSLHRSSWPGRTGAAPLRGHADRIEGNPHSRLAAPRTEALPSLRPASRPPLRATWRERRTP